MHQSHPFPPPHPIYKFLVLLPVCLLFPLIHMAANIGVPPQTVPSGFLLPILLILRIVGGHPPLHYSAANVKPLGNTPFLRVCLFQPNCFFSAVDWFSDFALGFLAPVCPSTPIRLAFSFSSPVTLMPPICPPALPHSVAPSIPDSVLIVILFPPLTSFLSSLSPLIRQDSEGL